MRRVEDRVRRLEEVLVHQPTVAEYIEADNREGVHALHVLAERAALRGFDSGYLFPQETLRMLSTDTPEQQAKDREIIDAWDKAHGRDRAAEAEGAKKRLLAKLEGRTRK